MSQNFDDDGILHLSEPVEKIRCPQCDAVIMLRNADTVLIRHLNIATHQHKKDFWVIRCRCKATLSVDKNIRLVV